MFFWKKAFFGGGSSDQTRPLQPNDTIRQNRVDLPLQVMVEFDQKQNGREVFIISDQAFVEPWPAFYLDTFPDTIRMRVSVSRHYKVQESGTIRIWDGD